MTSRSPELVTRVITRSPELIAHLKTTAHPQFEVVKAAMEKEIINGSVYLEAVDLVSLPIKPKDRQQFFESMKMQPVAPEMRYLMQIVAHQMIEFVTIEQANFRANTRARRIILQRRDVPTLMTPENLPQEKIIDLRFEKTWQLVYQLLTVIREINQD